ncbi:MAG: rod shape-determining protein RodA [Candidatus Spyradocola sp.]
MLRSRNRALSLGRQNQGRLDVPLMLITAALTIIGLIAVANATIDPYAVSEGTGIFSVLSRLTSNSFYWQLAWVGVGMVAIVLIQIFDYRVYGELAVYIFGVALALLVLVLFQTAGRGNVTAWFSWMGGSRSFQPSEVCKIAIILTLAKHISRYDGPIVKLKDFIPVLIHFAIPFALVIAQDDVGTALVFLAIFLGMLFVSGLGWKIIAGLGITGATACVAIWPFLSEFRQDRVLNFLNPARDTSGTGYQVRYSKIAVGSGQLTGKGLFQEGAISQLDFVPEKHTDFIFSVTAESVGFVGCILIIVLYLALVLRLFYLSYKMQDKFGSLIIAGVASMFLFHIFENIGMTIGLMPVTGIPLPFMSYGGSSMLANLAAVGLVLNVVRHQQKTVL